MLCVICSRLVQESTLEEWRFQHHPTYNALKEAADGGCQLCNFLRQALFSKLQSDYSFESEEVEELHHFLDLSESNTSLTGFVVERLGDTARGRVFIPAFFGQSLGGFIDSIQDRARSESEQYMISHVRSLTRWGCAGIRFWRDASRPPSMDPVKFKAAKSQIQIQFFSPKNSKAHLLGKVIGVSPSAEPQMALVKKWFSECEQNHKADCNVNDNVPLPPRLLDIAAPGDSHLVKLIISAGATGRYVTLSHRWGQQQPFCLTKDTEASLFVGVTLESLPKTFMDAVVIARRLGQRFLWIDSLCIAQDSDEDWERHCKEMPAIYQKAQINIASAWSSDAYGGILRGREMPIEPIELQWRVGNSESARVSLGYSPGDVMGFKTDLITRAWVLQERMLCQRMLYFGKHSMWWECSGCLYHEHSHDSLEKFIAPYENVKWPFRPRSDPRTFFWRFWDWYNLVRCYADTEMSYPSDKFPAISALARIFADVMQDEYVAGVWKGDFVRGLCWAVYSSAPERASVALRNLHTNTVNSSQHAPSWSWASLSYPTKSLGFPSDELVFNEGDDVEVFFPIISSVSVDPLGNDSFGRLKAASIELAARLFDVKLEYRPLQEPKGEHQATADSADPYTLVTVSSKTDGAKPYIWVPTSPKTGSLLTGRYYPDHRVSTSIHSHTPDSSLFRNVTITFLLLSLTFYQKWTIIYGLAISPETKGTNVYRRTGFVAISLELSDDFSNHFDLNERKDVVLI